MSEKRLSIHLVECSPQMRKQQQSTLCDLLHSTSHISDRNKDQGKTEPYECRAITKFGPQVYWYTRIEEVPKEFSFYIAHEFFDALPIHKFTRSKEGEWREILIDIDEKNNNKLRFVQSKYSTPATQLVDAKCNRDKKAIEISPKAGVIVQQLSDRIDKFGGGALIADYGQDEAAEDSFRGFKNHKLHDVLEEPGSADLTADVDFSYIRSQCSEHTVAYGPITQRHFLKCLGIDLRYKKLGAISSVDKTDLDSAYHSLTDENKMGKRFKFLSIFPKTMLPIHSQYPPAGFENKG